MRLAAMALTVALAPHAVRAEDGLALSGETRARYESSVNTPRPGLERSADILAFRSNILAEYSRGGWRMGADLWDSRVYGAPRDGSVTANDVNAAELVQLYVGWRGENVLGPGGAVSVQAGRFILNLGSRRLVAADDFRNTTSGHAGVRLDASRGAWSGTALYVMPQVRLPSDVDDVVNNRVRIDRTSRRLVLYGGVGAWKPRSGWTVDGAALRLVERDAPGRPTPDRRLTTLDLRLLRDPELGRFDLEVEAARQTGSISASPASDAARQRVRAGFLHAEAGYSWKVAGKPRLAVEYDLVGGDAPGGRYGRFDTLFGQRRTDFTPSGLFAVLGRANIQALGLRLEAEPTARLQGFVSWRRLRLDEATDSFSTSGVRDPSGRSGRDGGGAFDGRVRYWIVPERLRLEANLIRLHKGRFLRTAPNAQPTGDARYVTAALSASF